MNKKYAFILSSIFLLLQCSLLGQCIISDRCELISDIQTLEVNTSTSNDIDKVCIAGCFENASSESIVLCDFNNYQTVWYKIEIDTQAEYLYTEVITEGQWLPIWAVFTGQCNNLEVINAQNTSPCSDEDYSVFSHQTPIIKDTKGNKILEYYIAVTSTDLIDTDSFNICAFTTRHLDFCVGDNFNASSDPTFIAQIVGRENNEPLEGPFYPGEMLDVQVEFLYNGNDEGVDWLIGFIPHFGNGWEISSLDFEESLPVVRDSVPATWNPINGDCAPVIQEEVFNLCTYTDTNGKLVLCNIMSESCPCSSNGLSAGDVLPSGYFWISNGGSAGCANDCSPGEGWGVGTTQAPITWNFSMKVKSEIELEQVLGKPNLQLGMEVFNDGTLGCWEDPIGECSLHRKQLGPFWEIQRMPNSLNSISGVLWYEYNNNGTFEKDDGEDNIEQVLIQLFEDENCDGKEDTMILEQYITDGELGYEFKDLEDGCYIVLIPTHDVSVNDFLDDAQIEENYVDANINNDNDNNGFEDQEGNIRSAILNLEEGVHLLVDFGFRKVGNELGPYMVDSCHNAFAICDLNEINGLCGMLSDSLVADGPSPLCDGFGVGHNISWLSFVAGKGNWTLDIIPQNCEEDSGLQVGVFDDCSWTNNIYCNSFCMENVSFSMSSELFNPGQQYWMFTDGCSGSNCKFLIDLTGDFEPAELMVSDLCLLIGGEEMICQDSVEVCDGKKVDIIADNLLENTSCTWEVAKDNIDQVIKTDKNYLQLDSLVTGTYNICLTEAKNACYSIDTDHCITVEVKNTIIANDDDVTLHPDLLLIDILSNDTINLDNTTLSIINNPINGTIAGITDGIVEYSPQNDFIDQVDSFEYQLCNTSCLDMCSNAWTYINYTGETSSIDDIPIKEDNLLDILERDNCKVNLFNLQGQSIFYDENCLDLLHSINTRLTQGVYIYQVIIDEEIIYGNFVKM